MAKSILISNVLPPESMAIIPSDVQVDYHDSELALSRAQLIERLHGKDGLVCHILSVIDDELLAACPRLRVVANVAVGYNNIDVAACTRSGVMVTNTPGVLDESTADLAWALILATARRVTEAEAYLRSGEWKRWFLKQMLGADVHHATLGILGMGRIGQAIARRAAGFEMKVLYHNRNRVDRDIEERCRASYVTRDELLKQSDFVVLQVPYSRETHHLIGARELKLMKPTAILVNSTRGGVVDDAALIEALRSGVIRAAGLDVFENEPRLNPEFLRLDNVVLMPHIGSSTEATRRAMAMTAAQNLVAALTGGRPPNLLNPEVKKASIASRS